MIKRKLKYVRCSHCLSTSPLYKVRILGHEKNLDGEIIVKFQCKCRAVVRSPYVEKVKTPVIPDPRYDP